MRPFSEATPREQLSEGLRWLCVLPAAMVAGFVVRFGVGAVGQIVGFGGGGISGDSKFAYVFRVFLFYVPQHVAFVIAGAMTAPRFREGTAVVLTIVGILLSLTTHIVGQYFAGNRVGSTNVTHFVAESLGLLAGAGYIVGQVRRKRRTGMKL